MSGGSEANFELGYAVNVDSHVALLKATHAHAKATGQEGATKPVYVFVSSLAIYGGPKCRPQDFVVPDETPLLPGTSYGVEKNIIELYAYDYGRKGGWNDSDRADP
jgi:nucleoside-diphosphate-sugar epimerase